MSQFSFKLITIVYIQVLFQTNSQYTKIWNDTMEQNNGWTPSPFCSVVFGYRSSGCFNTLCTKTDAEKGINSYILRNTDISAYSSLQLQFDVSTVEHESGDTCRVYYAYDYTSAKTLIATIDPPDDEDRHFYPNQTVTFPSAVSKNTVYIWLETNAADTSGSDVCYWNNVYLNGILGLTPGTLQCGEEITGVYIGAPVTFLVWLRFDGSLIFDASNSDFIVREIRARSKSDAPIAADIDQDEIITLTDFPAGFYKFLINGDPDKDITSQYDIRIRCLTNNSTLSPTPPPTVLLECDDQITGDYNDESTMFAVKMDDNGDLMFDATLSDFDMDIEALDSSDQVLDVDLDDKQLILTDVVSGCYIFTINAESGTHGVYTVKIYCEQTLTTTDILTTNVTSPSKGSTTVSTNNINTFYGSLIDIFGINTLLIILVVWLLVCCCCFYMGCCVLNLQKRTKEIAAKKTTDTHEEQMVEMKSNEVMNSNEMMRSDELQNIQEDVSSSEEFKINDEMKEYHVGLVTEWFRDQVGLPQYLQMFLRNGYDSIAIIKRISNDRELFAMGIRRELHQAMIMAEIHRLKLQNDAEDGVFGVPKKHNEVVQMRNDAHPGFEGVAEGFPRYYDSEDTFMSISSSIQSKITPQLLVEPVEENILNEKSGKCADCGKFKEGKTFDEDGRFYCYECWDEYM